MGLKLDSLVKMAASKINWAQFLAEGSELPPDVTFAVMEEVHECSLFNVHIRITITVLTYFGLRVNWGRMKWSIWKTGGLYR